MAGRISKADAGYGPGQPHCGVCTHFQDVKGKDNGSCELVAGAISEDAWCRLFDPKRKATIAESGADYEA